MKTKTLTRTPTQCCSVFSGTPGLCSGHFSAKWHQVLECNLSPFCGGIAFCHGVGSLLHAATASVCGGICWAFQDESWWNTLNFSGWILVEHAEPFRMHPGGTHWTLQDESMMWWNISVQCDLLFWNDVIILWWWCHQFMMSFCDMSSVFDVSMPSWSFCFLLVLWWHHYCLVKRLTQPFSLANSVMFQWSGWLCYTASSQSSVAVSAQKSKAAPWPVTGVLESACFVCGSGAEKQNPNM